MMRSKRGELTTQQIVLMIILIASFAIILFLLVRLELGKTTDKELCYNSVLSRGSSVLPGESIPLKCQRSYVCLSADKKCGQMTKPDLKKVESKLDVYSVLAEEMANCWWMFGEGQVNYAGKDMLPEMYCSICSQIAFDDSINFFENSVINEEEFYGYLAENKIPGKEETYLEYLYGTNDLLAIKTMLNDQGVNFGTYNLDNQHYVMTGIMSDVSEITWVLGVAAFAFLPFAPLAGGTWGATMGVLAVYGAAGAGTGTAAGFIVEGLSGNDYLSPSIIEVNSEEYNSLGCKSVATLA